MNQKGVGLTPRLFDHYLSETIWLGASEHSQALMLNAPRVSVPL